MHALHVQINHESVADENDNDDYKQIKVLVAARAADSADVTRHSTVIWRDTVGFVCGGRGHGRDLLTYSHSPSREDRGHGADDHAVIFDSVEKSLRS